MLALLAADDADGADGTDSFLLLFVADLAWCEALCAVLSPASYESGIAERLVSSFRNSIAAVSSL